MTVIQGKLDPVTGKYTFTEIEDHPGLEGGEHSCKLMDQPGGCPNVCYEADQYDAGGKRISKHHWYCNQCDFLQVG